MLGFLAKVFILLFPINIIVIILFDRHLIVSKPKLNPPFKSDVVTTISYEIGVLVASIGRNGRVRVVLSHSTAEKVREMSEFNSGCVLDVIGMVENLSPDRGGLTNADGARVLMHRRLVACFLVALVLGRRVGRSTGGGSGRSTGRGSATATTTTAATRASNGRRRGVLVTTIIVRRIAGILIRRLVVFLRVHLMVEEETKNRKRIRVRVRNKLIGEQRSVFLEERKNQSEVVEASEELTPSSYPIFTLGYFFIISLKFSLEVPP